MIGKEKNRIPFCKIRTISSRFYSEIDFILIGISQQFLSEFQHLNYRLCGKKIS